jgi:hypothetical protein
MNIRVYVHKTKDGYLRADTEAADVGFICDVPSEMTAKEREQAAEILYTIEQAAIDYVTTHLGVLEDCVTVLVDLSAVAVSKQDH